MAQTLQFLMDHSLHNFIQIFNVLKENNEKIETSNLRLMSDGIFRNVSDIETTINMLDISNLHITEEQVSGVQQQHQQAVKRYKQLKNRLDSYQKAFRISSDNMVGQLYDRP